MKVQTFNNKDIVLVTNLTDCQKDCLEGKYPVLYHDQGFYIPGDCLSNLLKTYEITDIDHF